MDNLTTMPARLSFLMRRYNYNRGLNDGGTISRAAQWVCRWILAAWHDLAESLLANRLAINYRFPVTLHWPRVRNNTHFVVSRNMTRRHAVTSVWKGAWCNGLRNVERLWGVYSNPARTNSVLLNNTLYPSGLALVGASIRTTDRIKQAINDKL